MVGFSHRLGRGRLRHGRVPPEFTAGDGVRDADPITKSAVLTYTYYEATGTGAIIADDTARRDIDEALRSAETSADDIALGLALFTKANVQQQDPTQHEAEAASLKQARELMVGGPYYLSMVPVVDARLAELMIESGNLETVEKLRASVRDVFDCGMYAFAPWATDVLAEALLDIDATGNAAEVESVLERLATVTVLDGTVYRELVLLKSRALLAGARGDEAEYRDFAARYRDIATLHGFQGHIANAEALVGADGIEPPTAGV